MDNTGDENKGVHIVSAYRSVQQNTCIVQGPAAPFSSTIHKEDVYDRLRKSLRKILRNSEEIQNRWDGRCLRNRLGQSIKGCGQPSGEKKI